VHRRSHQHAAAASIGAAALAAWSRRGCWGQGTRPPRRDSLALFLALASLASGPLPCHGATAEVEEAEPPTAVVLLHGSGSSGEDLRRYLEAVDGGRFLESLAARGASTQFPDSGLRPYRLAGGLPMAVWYDRTGLPPSSPEDTPSVEASVDRLYEIVQRLQTQGIPARRIVVGGFSMGGGIALQLALRHPDSLGAVFALSSYMCDDAAAYRQAERSKSASWPQVFMAHGQADDFIRFEWGSSTADRLAALGLPVRFLPLPDVRHELARSEIEELRAWLDEVLHTEPEGSREGPSTPSEL